jgi:hypothetical protein
MKERGPFDGYQGADAFLFNENSLVNSFPVTLPESTTAQVRKVYYKLVKEEGAIILRPDRWSVR